MGKSKASLVKDEALEKQNQYGPSNGLIVDNKNFWQDIPAPPFSERVVLESNRESGHDQELNSPTTSTQQSECFQDCLDNLDDDLQDFHECSSSLKLVFYKFFVLLLVTIFPLVFHCCFIFFLSRLSSLSVPVVSICI